VPSNENLMKAQESPVSEASPGVQGEKSSARNAVALLPGLSKKAIGMATAITTGHARRGGARGRRESKNKSYHHSTR